MEQEPKTLQEAAVFFSDEARCREYIIKRRWPDGVVVCPTCGNKSVRFSEKHNRWQCGSHHQQGRQFTVKTGTIFEDSALPLGKWLVAMWLLTNCKNGVSSWEIHRALGVTQKTAWFMLHRIRYAAHSGSPDKLSGECEVDESFIGGKARNMHMDVRKRRITGRGPSDKTAVFGVLERGKGDGGHSRIRTKVINDRKKGTLQAEVKANVQAGTALYSDALLSYDGLESEYAHQVVDHAVEYVRGRVHTNGLENFWSLFKRGINGTYVSVEPFHLFRYLDEQEFRFNNRGTRDNPITDSERFDLVVRQILGKRLTYQELIGKEAVAPEPF
jgi:transposase-like protein